MIAFNRQNTILIVFTTILHRFKYQIMPKKVEIQRKTPIYTL